MRFPESKVIEALREKYPAGCRVKLTKMDDVQAPPIGTLGTVDCVDDIGSIHVKWDTGSRLAVAYGADECQKIRKILLTFLAGAYILHRLFSQKFTVLSKSGILEIEKEKERLEKEC